MTRLEELVSRGPVEWRTLGDVADVTLQAGREFAQYVQYSDTGTIIALRALNVRGRLDLSQIKYIDGSNLEKLARSKLYRNDLLLTRVGSVGRVALVDCDDRYYLGQNLCRIRFAEVVEPRFALHYFQTAGFRALNFRHHIRRSTMDHLSTGSIREFWIPIPPIARQREIADVLDAFSERERELEGLLTAELAARRKQYEYYRKQLQVFGEGEAEWRPLGEVVQIKVGGDYRHLSPGEYPVYGSGGVMTYVNAFTYKGPSVLIPRKGSLGNLFYMDSPFWNVNTTYYTIIDEQCVVPKFLYYFLEEQHLERLDISGAIPSLTRGMLYEIRIPIPPLARQQEIADVLDKFYALSHGLSEGLPAELEARRKQYAYYRERLMSFPQPSDAGGAGA